MKSVFVFFLLSIINLPSLAQDYLLEQVSVSPYQKSIQRAGKINFKRTLKLSFKSGGYLKKLAVDEGDFFNKTKLLASLETVELKAEKNYRYAELLQAKRDVKRFAKLVEKNLASKHDLDNAQTQLEKVRSAYRVAYYNLDKSEIIAPFDGVVLKRLTDLDELQSPGKEVIEVAATNNNLVVRVALTDSEISMVELGQTVRVQLPHNGITTGIVSKIPAINNDEDQLFLVDILLDNIKAGQGIIAGQLAHVALELTNDNYVYQVPIGALIKVNDAGQAVLFVKNDNSDLVQSSFDVTSVDSQYIYLSARSNDQTLAIVTQGWQQLIIAGK